MVSRRTLLGTAAAASLSAAAIAEPAKASVARPNVIAIVSKTVQRLLKDNGYRTGLYGKFLNGWNINAAPPHFDEFALLQPGYQNATYNVDGTVQTINGYSTTVLKNRALGFIDRADDRPWFLYFIPYAPHGPNTPEAKYADIAVPPWSGRPSVPEANRTDKPGLLRLGRRTPANRGGVGIRRTRWPRAKALPVG
nr:sulfatase-like hydrolase/transferase [Catelliglobosispora koreensis]